MNTLAMELIEAVEARGGQIMAKGENLVVNPREAGLPLVEELRVHKPAILAALQARHVITSHSEEISISLALHSAFVRWESERCVFWRGLGGASGIARLQVSFCEWAVAHEALPCTRRTFERLLADTGFAIGDGIVWGLMLRDEIKGRKRFKAPREEVKSDRCGSKGLFEGLPPR